jgi:hypothetical protein
MATSTSQPSDQERLADSMDRLRLQNETLVDKLDLVASSLSQFAQFEQTRQEQQQWMDRTWETSKLLINLAFGLITAATVTVIVTALLR